MGFSDQEKRRLLVLTRRLRDEKGIAIKQDELQEDIQRFQDGINELEQIKEEYKDTPVVVEEAKESQVKLERIIGDLNEYMSIIHPEGLLDLGSDSQGQTVMASG